MPARRPVSIRRDDVVYDDEYSGRRSRSGGGDDWWSSRAGDEAKVEKELEKRRARGESLRAAVPVNSRTLSNTFWGQAWNRNLMGYSDYESRMPRGRSYFRAGKVMDLDIGKGKVSATVAGTRIYDVSVVIKPLASEAWDDLKRRCQGKIGGLVELLSGALSEEVMREVTDLDRGLFPAPREMKLSCTCPDYAGLCKHIAATLYAVGSRLDEQPALLFALRGVDLNEMFAADAVEAIQHLTAPAAADVARRAALAGVDFGGLFGIEAGSESSLASLPPPVRKIGGRSKKPRHNH
jgi:uncharacterized Zn finger protein